MKIFLKKNISWLIALVVFGAVVYFFRADLLNVKNTFFRQYLPCQKPITYQLGEFDERFGISKKDFLAAVADAEMVWEKPSGLNLFEYAENGVIKINLIYDYRQHTTAQLQELGIVVEEDQATYDMLQAKYESLEKTYLTDRANVERQAEGLDRRIAAYNSDVEKASRRGKVASAEIERLEAEREDLNRLVEELNVLQEKVNNEADNLNAVADALNGLAETLNLSVERYNTIGASRGREFEEGTYRSSAGIENIDIYQFEDRIKLLRVLAHEFGHALGLGHVSSTQAIMYYLNESVNEELTPDDLSELRRHCGIE